MSLLATLPLQGLCTQISPDPGYPQGPGLGVSQHATLGLQRFALGRCNLGDTSTLMVILMAPMTIYGVKT